jgi:hypothetical protein
MSNREQLPRLSPSDEQRIFGVYGQQVSGRARILVVYELLCLLPVLPSLWFLAQPPRAKMNQGGIEALSRRKLLTPCQRYLLSGGACDVVKREQGSVWLKPSR